MKIHDVKSTRTGLDSAPGIPAGARVAETAWHVALHYGPSLPYPTERDALVAAIEAADEAAAERPGFTPSLTIDLRWKLQWDQGALDSNGRTTHSSGLGFTVHRTTYLTPDDARNRLANMDAVYGEPAPTVLRNGDTVTITGDPVVVTVP